MKLKRQVVNPTLPLLQDLQQRQRRAQKQRDLHRSFIGIAGIALIVIVICSAAMYWILRSILVNQCIDSATQQFEQIQLEFDTINEDINATSTQIILDELCSTWLMATGPQQFDELELRKIRRQLSMYMNVDNRIGSIYLYNGIRSEFLCTDHVRVYPVDQFPDPGLVDIMNHYDQYYSRNLIRREVPNGAQTDTVYSYILSYFQDPVVTNAIIVNIDPDKLSLSMLSTNAMRDSEIIIVDEKGSVWNRFSGSALLEEDDSTALISQLQDSPKGYQDLIRNGRRFFVSWETSRVSGWKFIKISHWNQIFAPLNKLLICILAVLLMVLAAVLVVALYGSFSVRSIAQQLEQQKLTQKVASLVQSRSKGFWDELFHHTAQFTPEELIKNLEQEGFPLQNHPVFTLLHLQEDGESDTDPFVLQTIRRKCCRLLEDILNVECTAKGVETRSGVVVLAASDPVVSTEHFHRLFEQFQMECRGFTQQEFNLICHPIGEDPAAIPEAVHQLSGVLDQTFFYPAGSFLTYEELSRHRGSNVDYWKLDIETAAEHICLKEDNHRAFMEFAAKLSCCDSKDFRSIIVWLGIAVIKKWRELPYEIQMDPDEVILRLTACRKEEQVIQLFSQICAAIRIGRDSSRVSARTSSKISEVENHILEHYMDQNLSADYLSELYGITPNYLRRVFKKENGMSISDYINEVRLQNVLEQLRTTNESIKHIADSCGFLSANHFYTYFKKKTGMTPNQYRTQFSEED